MAFLDLTIYGNKLTLSIPSIVFELPDIIISHWIYDSTVAIALVVVVVTFDDVSVSELFADDTLAQVGSNFELSDFFKGILLYSFKFNLINIEIDFALSVFDNVGESKGP